MPTEMIDNLADPRLDPFRDLKAQNSTRSRERFVAEGVLVVERLLQSDFAVASVVSVPQLALHIGRLVPHEVPLFVVDEELAGRLVGFSFHAGVLAEGVRRPMASLDDLIGTASPALIAVCPNVNDPENVGSIIRLSAGFGLGGVLLGPGCPDPFSRRVLRVSMGTVLRVPVRETENLRADLNALRDCGFELAATLLDGQAEPLHSVRPADRMAVLLGNEKHGLERHWIDLCSRRITIPMKPDADSLNVAMSAGIVFHHLLHVRGENS